MQTDFTPARRASIAADIPAGPPPMMTRSICSLMGGSLETVGRVGSDRNDRVAGQKILGEDASADRSHGKAKRCVEDMKTLHRARRPDDRQAVWHAGSHA